MFEFGEESDDTLRGFKGSRVQGCEGLRVQAFKSREGKGKGRGGGENCIDLEGVIRFG